MLVVVVDTEKEPYLAMLPLGGEANGWSTDVGAPGTSFRLGRKELGRGVGRGSISEGALICPFEPEYHCLLRVGRGSMKGGEPIACHSNGNRFSFCKQEAIGSIAIAFESLLEVAEMLF